MLEKIILLDDVSEEDLEEVFRIVESNPSIIATSLECPYSYFLGTVFGYVRQHCDKDPVDTIYKLEGIVRRAAGAINMTESSLSNIDAKEIEKLRELVKNYLTSNNKPGVDVFDFGVSRRLGINFLTELLEFIKSPSLSEIDKEILIEYILEKHKIIAESDLSIPPYSEENFINSLVSRNMERKLPIYFDDMSEFFQEQIDEEKEALGSDLLRRSKEETYTSKYPGLTKALLIKSIREEVERIRKEHQDEEVFVVQLNQFLEALSKYDTEFLRSFRVLIPANEFSEGIRTILTRELHASENFRNGKDNTIKLAVKSRISSENNGIEGQISPKEMITYTPKEFKRQMYDGYRAGNAHNVNAVLLSQAMSQFCRTKRGGRLTPKQIQDALYNRFLQKQSQHQIISAISDQIVHEYGESGYIDSESNETGYHGGTKL